MPKAIDTIATTLEEKSLETASLLLFPGSAGKRCDIMSAYKIALQYAWLRAASAAATTAGLYDFIAAAPLDTTAIRSVTLDSGSPAETAAEGTYIAVYFANELL